MLILNCDVFRAAIECVRRSVIPTNTLFEHEGSNRECVIMLNRSCLVFSGIAPHPPIMVPEVGRESIPDVQASIEAMAEFTRRLIASEAETVILISPHAPLEL